MVARVDLDHLKQVRSIITRRNGSDDLLIGLELVALQQVDSETVMDELYSLLFSIEQSSQLPSLSLIQKKEMVKHKVTKLMEERTKCFSLNDGSATDEKCVLVRFSQPRFNVDAHQITHSKARVVSLPVSVLAQRWRECMNHTVSIDITPRASSASSLASSSAPSSPKANPPPPMYYTCPFPLMPEMIVSKPFNSEQMWKMAIHVLKDAATESDDYQDLIEIFGTLLRFSIWIATDCPTYDTGIRLLEHVSSVGKRNGSLMAKERRLQIDAIIRELWNGRHNTIRAHLLSDGWMFVGKRWIKFCACDAAVDVPCASSADFRHSSISSLSLSSSSSALSSQLELFHLEDMSCFVDTWLACALEMMDRIVAKGLFVKGKGDGKIEQDSSLDYLYKLYVGFSDRIPPDKMRRAFRHWLHVKSPQSIPTASEGSILDVTDVFWDHLRPTDVVSGPCLGIFSFLDEAKTFHKGKSNEGIITEWSSFGTVQEAKKGVANSGAKIYASFSVMMGSGAGGPSSATTPNPLSSSCPPSVSSPRSSASRSSPSLSSPLSTLSSSTCAFPQSSTPSPSFPFYSHRPAVPPGRNAKM